MLQNLADQKPEDYEQFWDMFGSVLKEGTGEDFANREAVLKLLRFATTRSDGKAGRVGLDTYLERAVEGQDRIYYLVADSWETARSSPHLEIFRERGIEVLLLHERIDEWMMANLTEYQGKSFQDVARGDLRLPGEPADAVDADDAEQSPLTQRIAAALGDRVESVRPSRRLKDSPACLVLGEFDLGPQMRRIMEATGQKVPESKPVFEYNLSHPLVERLDREPDEDRFRELAGILFDQATLAGGGNLADAAGYVERLNRLLLALLSD